jgi:hypothetical protein
MKESIPTRTGVGWDGCDEHQGPKHKECVSSARALPTCLKAQTTLRVNNKKLLHAKRSYRVFGSAFAVVLCLVNRPGKNALSSPSGRHAAQRPGLSPCRMSSRMEG